MATLRERVSPLEPGFRQGSEQKLLFDVSGGSGVVPDLMLTSSLEGSLDDDYLVRNRAPVYGDPGRDALLLGRMQSLTCEQAPAGLPQDGSGRVFSGVPISISSPLMVRDSLNRPLNLYGGGNFNLQSPFECPEMKLEDDVDLPGALTGDLLLNLSMSMSLSFTKRLSNKFSFEDYQCMEPGFSFPYATHVDNGPEPLMKDPGLAAVKPKIEDGHGPGIPVSANFHHDFVVGANVSPGSPSAGEFSIGHNSESEAYEHFEEFNPAPQPVQGTMEVRKSNRTRRDVLRSSKNTPKGGGRCKGVTMCLRTLLRQLLAGTGWIMDSSMSKDHATQLIRQLIGPSLDKKCLIQLSPEQAESMSSDTKELHYSKLLADLTSTYIGTPITYETSLHLIKRDKGPYHLTQHFIDLLDDKPWPPNMISEKELRVYGCYRQGEASRRGKGGTPV